MSQPHIFTGEVFDAIKSGWKDGNDWEINAAAEETFKLALERIGQEELWLFKSSISGSKEIEALNIHPAAKEYLLNAWGNRLLFEYEKDSFVPVWFYKENRAYRSLSKEEQDELETMFEDKKIKSEKIWEKEGKKLLSVLASSSSMLPCAEDLGAVPACVPKVLKELDILGLRVVRWHREWDKEGQPYVPFEDYPELSACTPAVHDSSTLREWWDREADQELFAGFLGFPSLSKVENPGTANHILFQIATAASRFRVFQFQDLLHLSTKWYAPDPADERINVPGTQNEFNWTWRLPTVPAQIAKDEGLLKTVKELSEIPAAVKKAAAKKAKR
jgi:4-alpha-glucanotransferase